MLNKCRGRIVLDIECRQCLLQTLIKTVCDPSRPPSSLNRSIFAACVKCGAEVSLLRDARRSAWRLGSDGKQHDIGIVLAANAQTQIPRSGALRNRGSLLQNLPSDSSEFGLRFARGNCGLDFFLTLINHSTLVVRHPRVISSGWCEIGAECHGSG